MLVEKLSSVADMKRIIPISFRYTILRDTHITGFAMLNFEKVRRQHTISKDYDLVIIGGGIIGTASAREIIMRHPHIKIAVLEKEKKLGVHQSSHNSGVIHAGIYYKPGTLKAKLCVQGLNLSYKYFDERNIPYKKCGKLVVATNKLEEERLTELLDRGTKNGVPDLKLIDGVKIKDYEPHCRGVKALWSPYTGIVDWGLVTWNYGEDFKKAGGDIYMNYKVISFNESVENSDYPVTIIGSEPTQKIQAKSVLTCGGLQSDLLAELTGCSRTLRIVPFRGEYLMLSMKIAHMIRGNIYAVPDPKHPSLGVHFTPCMDGSVLLGPNAVMAFKREGYSRFDVNFLELFESISHPGFYKMTAKHYKFGISEMLKSAITPLRVKDLQKYVPEILETDVSRGPTGVRAQVLDEQGNLVDDLIFEQGTGKGVLAKKVLHCRNTPWPGATSSLAVAQIIADKVENEFNLKFSANFSKDF